MSVNKKHYVEIDIVHEDSSYDIVGIYSESDEFIKAINDTKIILHTGDSISVIAGEEINKNNNEVIGMIFYDNVENQKVNKKFWNVIKQSEIKMFEDIKTDNAFTTEEIRSESKVSNLFSFLRKQESEPLIEQNTNLIETIMGKRILNEEKNETIIKENSLETIKKETTNEIQKEEKPPIFEEMYSKTFGTTIKEMDKNKEEAPEVKNLFTYEDKEKYEVIPQYKYCGTVFSTYIVIEMDKEMYIIDQHAAHERIMYEKVK